MKRDKPVIPGRAKWMLERLRGYEQKYNMSLDLEEEYLDIYYRRGKTGAGIWYWL